MDGGSGSRDRFENDPCLSSQRFSPASVATEADDFDYLTVAAEEGEETSFEKGSFDRPINVAQIEGGVGRIVGLWFDLGEG